MEDPGDAAVEAAVRALAAGEMVLVVDDAGREDEGDLVLAAEYATPRALAFLVRHTTGIVCAPMTGAHLDQLHLPPMVADSTDPHGTAFTVSVDGPGTTTGVSAADRATTLRALADPSTRAGDLRRPGHVFPLRARDGGVLERPGHTEAAVDLLQLAGLRPVGVIGELVAEDGSMARPAQVAAFAARHGLPRLDVADLVRYRRRGLPSVVRSGSAALPTAHGPFRAVSYRSVRDGVEHLALVAGDVGDDAGPGVLVRVHSECLTGDVVGSLRCDCGSQLESALQAVAAAGRGVVVYLRGHEGRGIGLGHKLRAYRLQEQGRDTVEANTDLGLPVDAREYDAAAAVLADLGVRRVRLMTNNPAKSEALLRLGVDVAERVGLPTVVNPHSRRYLYTKRDRMGHLLVLPDPAPTGAVAARPA